MLRILKFSASWCGPCVALKPIWEELVKNNEGVEFEAIDVDSDPNTTTSFKIVSIPTIVFIKDGVELDRVVGLVRKGELQKRLDALK
jgi:thioredoxin 1